MKKIISLLIAVLFVFAVIPFSSCNVTAATVSQVRQDVVDYVYKMATVKWTAGATFSTYKGGTYYSGNTYYGIPYSQSSSIGTVDYESFVKKAGTANKISTDIGRNDCISMILSAYSKVDSGVKVSGQSTTSIKPGSNNIVKVGDYTYTENKSTTCSTNGQSVMYAAYAKLQPGDLIVKDGHAILVVSVDTTNKKLTVIEQTGANKYYNTSTKKCTDVSSASARNTAWDINDTLPFSVIYNAGYIPLTCKALANNTASRTRYTFSYNANGGSGSVSSGCAYNGAGYVIENNAFTHTGYNFSHYTVKRSDNTWYVAGTGWLTESEIKSGGYTKKPYTSGEVYTINDSWTGGATTAFSYTFYAEWVPAEYKIFAYENHSQKNYILDSAFVNGLDTATWYSRDTSVSTISCDSSVKRVSDCNTLKIVNASAGSSGKDLAIPTATNGNVKDNGYNGDTKNMTLSFWAKSSKAGTKMYFRWGYQSTYRSVTLSTEWTYYTVSMNKTNNEGYYMHPYVDSAGTVWLSELQLEDGSSATAFVNESGKKNTFYATYESTYSDLPTPVRDGYVFDGWYTSNSSSAERIDTNTTVLPYNLCLYARWSNGLVGDVNDDKIVDSLDYVIVKRACFNTYKLSDDEYSRANANGDDTIDSLDYVLVKRIAFGTASM